VASDISHFPSHSADSAFINAVLAALDNFDIVSFDVFDTAITRRVDSPADVFAAVEKSLVSQFGKSAIGFALAREQAEKNARHRAWEKGHEDTTLDEIYASLRTTDPVYEEACEEALRLEVEIELELICPVPTVRDLVQTIRKRNKSVIFVSDMYHSATMLRRMLHECGYDIAERVFVSSETRFTKASGNQWQYLTGLLGQKNILHVGDDIHSDVEMPEKFGIKTRHFPSCISERRMHPVLKPQILPFSLIRRDAEMRYRSITNSTQADWWYAQGASTGAIVVYAFCKWLRQRAEVLNIHHLYFCARDGFLIQKAWEASGFDTGTTTHSYIYLSRRPLNFASGYLTSSSVKLSPSFLDFLSTSWRNTTLRTAIDRISEDGSQSLLRAGKHIFGDIDKRLVWDVPNQFRDFMQKNASEIYEVARKQYKAIAGYLEQEKVLDGRRLAIVDLGWTGSIQTSLSQIRAQHGVSGGLSGFYYGLWPDAAGKRYSAGCMEAAFGSDFKTVREQAYLRNAIDILEAVHCANAGTVVSYRKSDSAWSPITSHNATERTQHQYCTEPFQRGVLDTIKTWTSGGNVAGINAEDVTIDAAIAALSALTLSPSKSELSNYGQLKYCQTFEHGKFDELICRTPPDSMDEATHLLETIAWPIGTMRYWAAEQERRADFNMQELARRMFEHLGERTLKHLA